MKKIALLILFLQSLALFGQYSRHLIRLKNKQGTPYTISNASPYLSFKAIERRSRQQISIDSTDLPVSAVYLDSIRSVPNVQLISSSKWLNKVLIVTTDAAALARIRAFPFVESSAEIAPVALPRTDNLINNKFPEIFSPLPRRAPAYGMRQNLEKHDEISYGNNINQVHIHEGEYLHNRGFRGQGITIAMLDAGYTSVPTNPAFDSLRNDNRILGAYDFVTNTSGISQAHGHGMNCLSVIAANRPGLMVGTAPSANFFLLRTENASSEFPVEEYFWARAAEFADSAGADMISSSLGYYAFDNPIFNHSHSDRDGNTCMSTIAADLAAKKGMIVMNSAGNSGNYTNENKYVACPADGDSVVAVGAIRADGQIAGFSSWGPNGAGKVKPDLVSIGQGAIVINGAGNPVSSNGTSFSNPNLAGLFACLWQAFPEFSNMEIVEVVKRSADRYANPDERFGYGIPNFRVAFELLQLERTRRNSETILNGQWIRAFPVPFNSYINIVIKAPNTGQAHIRLLDFSGRILQTRQMSVTAGQVYNERITGLDKLASALYFIQYIDGQQSITIKASKKY